MRSGDANSLLRSAQEQDSRVDSYDHGLVFDSGQPGNDQHLHCKIYNFRNLLGDFTVTCFIDKALNPQNRDLLDIRG